MAAFLTAVLYGVLRDYPCCHMFNSGGEAGERTAIHLCRFCVPEGGGLMANSSDSGVSGVGRSDPGKKTLLTETGKNVLAAGYRSSYDTEAINVIKDRQFLARILKDCAHEFSDMQLEDIMSCIEDLSVRNTAVHPGLTNSAIVGMPTESKISGEGVVRYDIRFCVRNPKASQDDISRSVNIRILVDVELQKTEKLQYDIVERGVVYGGRMISEQLGSKIRHSDYGAVQKVYSIWICMNCSQELANTITEYSLKDNNRYGSVRTDHKSRYDLLSVVVIRLPKEKDLEKVVNKPTKLMELLSIVFSHRMPVNEKLNKLSRFGIQVSEEIEGSVLGMCNLSEGIYEEGLEEGIGIGREEGIGIGREEGIEIGQQRERENTEREKQRADRLQAEVDRLKKMIAG